MKTQPKIITSQCTDWANNTKHKLSFILWLLFQLITNLKRLERWGQLKVHWKRQTIKF